ncbi:MAG: TonB-dependent hemoglobin/transferrin/lactoferrin family receptor [Neisseria sp.]|uniref:TonB-dependent hemoglobin/transferrin/lactoferrin family receptor n=1 Tax=Neisseria sp. TaxID=192066 RepID=UPI0026DA93BC|nr:TonB-dependent hemoglobin/transferrin/lactoferrin family receptor [Neisseria sp.]MDO4640637.1 TonB-dependent hemoglobin/transferrin/lactoferrin family receptor [Neisseria sp.]
MKTLKIIPLAVFIGVIYGNPTYADTPAGSDYTEVAKVTVKGKRQTAPTTERVNAQTIQEQMIRDTRDLVRYSPDVGIVDNGRHLKGFAIRGVEGNRVGISVDGVSLPDSEENTLYSRYGNFNPSRLSIDTELVNNIDIVKGADSFQSGSGALGGNVNYRTLNAGDIVQPDHKFGALLRHGYATKNREWTNTAGFGFRGDTVDAALLYSQRYGHEFKSRGSGPEYNYNSSQHPDPAEHRNHSYLAKINWQIAPEHRVGFSINGQNGSNYTNERSYNLFGSAWREADDQHKRINSNLYYEYTPESDWLSALKTDFDYQYTDLAAVNYKGSGTIRSLDEIYDRRFKTHYKRLNFQIDSQPFRLGGEHNLSFKTFVSQREFKNLKIDTEGVGKDYQQTTVETIQYPIQTTQLGFSLKDNIIWNPIFSNQIGIRYDYTKLKPQDLNAPCSKACTAEGKPGNASFSNWNGFTSLFAQINPTWKVGYNLSTGYRVPTASEMYFTFKNPYGSWQSNRNLKSERSVNHSISVQANNDRGSLDLSAYHNRYRNFLLEQTNLIEQTEYGRTFQTPVSQTVNIEKAQISGLEFKGRLNLFSGWKLSGALGYSHGKLSDVKSLLSIQPLKAIIGLDYEQPEGKWGVFSRLTYLGGKKPRDAKAEDVKTRCLQYEIDPSSGEMECTEISDLYKEVYIKPLNKKAYVFDVYGFYKPIKNLTLRAGIYNVFNRKYHTWDALRGINSTRTSTTNTVDDEGKGLERYYAPGRNYAVSLEYKF